VVPVSGDHDRTPVKDRTGQHGLVHCACTFEGGGIACRIVEAMRGATLVLVGTSAT
jgi:hypothetical protein